jgi:hypothetical protein
MLESPSCQKFPSHEVDLAQKIAQPNKLLAFAKPFLFQVLAPQSGASIAGVVLP